MTIFTHAKAEVALNPLAEVSSAFLFKGQDEVVDVHVQWQTKLKTIDSEGYTGVAFINNELTLTFGQAQVLRGILAQLLESTREPSVGEVSWSYAS